MVLTVMHQQARSDAHGNHPEEDQTIRQHVSSTVQSYTTQ